MRSRLLTWSACLLAGLGASSNASAQDAPSAPPPPEPFLLLETSRDCATPQNDEILVDALELRIPSVFIVRGALDGVTPDWHVTWQPRPDGLCELTFRGAETESSMALSTDASTDEVQLAASRVAWLASVAPAPRPDGATTGAHGDPDPAPVEEEPVEDPPVEEPPVEEPPVEEPPVEEPPVEEPPVEEEPVEEETVNEEASPEEEPEPAAEPATETATSFQRVGALVSATPGLPLFPLPVPDRAVPGFSFNLIGGDHYGLDGFEVGLLFNRERAFMKGAQVALGANIVDGDHTGTSIALGANIVGPSEGALISLGLNLVNGESRGVHIGGVNLAGPHAGAQVGLINGALSIDNGVQVGFGNYAGDVDGAQVSLVNIARDVDGGQVGIVNIARTSDVSVGLLSILYGEPLYGLAAISSTAGITAGLQHGSKYFRWTWLGGYEPLTPKPNWRAGLGVGLHLPLSWFWLAAEGLGYAVVPAGDSIVRVSQLLEAKLSAGWAPAKRFSLFGSVSGKALLTGLTDGEQLVPQFAAGVDNPDGTRWFAWPELAVGVRF